MRIVLVRHGRPDAVNVASISGREIGQWTRHYNSVGVARSLPPPEPLRLLASEADCVVASNLRRARASAEWLAGDATVRSDPELREAALPESLRIPLRLPPGTWIVLARVLWLLNACAARETIAQARQRAERVANRLEALAAEHDTVMAVGHGMFNRFVASRLRRHGWQGPRSLPRQYWTAAEFTRRAEPSRRVDGRSGSC